MTCKDRLTQWDEYGNADIIALSDMMPEIYAELSYSETNALTDVLNKLAELEDKLENDTLIEPPCNVGDKVYVICYKRNVQPYIRVETVLHMNYLQGKSLSLWQIHTEYAAYNAKDVIYSKSEAEQKLKELQDD